MYEFELNFEEILLLKNLTTGRDIDGNSFGINTCFDFVERLFFDKEKNYCITVFVEPCGDITKCGSSFEAVLRWWIVAE